MPSKPVASATKNKPAGKPAAVATRRTPAPPPQDEQETASINDADDGDEGIVFDIKEAVSLLPTGLVAVGTVVACKVGKVATGANAGVRKWSARIKIEEVPDAAPDSCIGRLLFKTLIMSENAMPFVHQFIAACEGTETDTQYKARDMDGRSVGMLIGYKPAANGFDEGNEVTRFMTIEKARDKFAEWKMPEASGVGAL